MQSHNAGSKDRIAHFDRHITSDNPLSYYVISHYTEFGKPMYPPEPTGDMKMVVHSNATRGDATIFMDVGSDANLEHFKREPNFNVVLIARNGRAMWSGRFRWWNIHRDDKYVAIGHLGAVLPNEGEYHLKSLSLLEYVWMIARYDEEHRWNEINDPMSVRAWLKRNEWLKNPEAALM